MQVECPECGVIGLSGERCIKCDDYLTIDDLFKVDIAHHRENFNEAVRKMQCGVGSAWQDGYKGVMIIHGFGSQLGHTSIIHDQIKPFIHQAGRGLNARVVPAKYNKGVHLLYFNRVNRRLK